jgi:hypothetical protein
MANKSTHYYFAATGLIDSNVIYKLNTNNNMSVMSVMKEMKYY